MSLWGGGGLSDFELDILLLAGYKYGDMISLAQTSKAKRIIAPAYFQTFFAKRVEVFFYNQLRPHREVFKALELVRRIDKKHFDENISKIDFKHLALKTLPKHKRYIDILFKSFQAEQFKFIVGINAFANSAYKFVPQDYAYLAKDLAREFPQVLFVMMSYDKNLIEYKEFEEKNIQIFIGDNEFFHLIELTSRLDMLISPDTGNVHIADIFKVSILQTMKTNLRLKWGGGSWGNECQMLLLNNKWIKNYNKLKFRFNKLAKDMIVRLLDKA
ncbi:glycosyltransferase family 9 protein [Campylobacter sp. MIT 97-5078]|uniref:glycosyltransferase family 9 protein n=2 Tax=Campylobacter sp. MIT 97-5078 TaxID=1548153 RepID=UPI0011603B5E|nr:glycosyltransferase family 9 protein [Campylobacter sp. MIT 97-5078]